MEDKEGTRIEYLFKGGSNSFTFQCKSCGKVLDNNKECDFCGGCLLNVYPKVTVKPWSCISCGSDIYDRDLTGTKRCVQCDQEVLPE